MCELINFKNLGEKEKLMILEWRNHIDIKKWMKNRQEISLKEHLEFLNKLENNKNKNYFLVKKNGEYIGVVVI